MLRLPVLFMLFANAYVLSLNSANPIVRTPLGKVQGSILTTVLGKSIFSFRSIRYAKAPINELRFMPPVAVDKWEGVYDATKDGPECPQPSDSNVSEDCLLLNVYSAQLPTGENNPNRAVIVYFHAGGYYSLSGSSVWEGPQYFLDQDIVLVTVNYRLASLGFLSTGDKLSPGNYGMKDQVAALRWVKDNIASFGGNPNQVTICGYSAGGASVTLHLVSPMSRGLFHNAIAMSGSILGNWPVEAHQFNLAQKQARLLNCPDDTSGNILNCLRTKSAVDLGNSLDGFDEFRSDPILKWIPVIEPDCGQERFLVEHPIKSVLNGDFADVPVMAGVTTLEFAEPAFQVVNNQSLLREIDEEFERVAPIAFIYERDTENSKAISKKLRKWYLGDGPLTNTSLPGLEKLYADGVIGFGVNRGVKLLSEKTRKHVYYYHFGYKGRYSHFYLPGTQIPYGVVHHDDLIYMFYISRIFPKFNETTPEYAMVKKLTTLIRNFAYTGNPTPKKDDVLDGVEWQPFTNKRKKYLDIGNKLTMKSNLYESRYVVWEDLFPLRKYN